MTEDKGQAFETLTNKIKYMHIYLHQAEDTLFGLLLKMYSNTP